MKHIAASIALSLATSAAVADIAPDSASVPIYVHHANYDHDGWNQGVANNLGILLEWEVNEVIDFTAGFYNNSFAKFSATSFITWSPIQGENWKLGIMAGLATYDFESTPLDMPTRIGDSDFVAMGSVRAEYGSVYATYTPAGEGGRAIITSGISFDF